MKANALTRIPNTFNPKIAGVVQRETMSMNVPST
jgi:hypothetical protein